MENKEILNFLIVGCISADNCVDIKSCEKSLEHLENIREMLPKFKLTKEETEFYNKKIDDGINVVRRDLEDFKKNEEK